MAIWSVETGRATFWHGTSFKGERGDKSPLSKRVAWIVAKSVLDSTKRLERGSLLPLSFPRESRPCQKRRQAGSNPQVYPRGSSFNGGAGPGETSVRSSSLSALAKPSVKTKTSPRASCSQAECAAGAPSPERGKTKNRPQVGPWFQVQIVTLIPTAACAYLCRAIAAISASFKARA